MDYKHLRAWCNMIGSFPYYTERQVDQARRDKAPADAVYTDATGQWIVYSEVTDPSTRATMDRKLTELTELRPRTLETTSRYQ